MTSARKGFEAEVDPLERLLHPPRCGDRSLFPELRARAYLGHAAISPVSIATQRHCEAALNDLGRFGAGCFLAWEGARRSLVRDLETLLGATRGSVALTAGTSYGIGALALALPLSSGTKLASFQGEFPANITPWSLAARRFGAELLLLAAPEPLSESPKERVLRDAERALQSGVKYLVVSAVQFQTGYRMPLEELGLLCEEYGAFFLVDAIQAVGAVPLDVERCRISALTGGAHKWLLGVEGAGYLYVSPALMRTLEPLTAGWLSHVDGEKFLFEGEGHLAYERPLKSDVTVFEGSSASILGHAALQAGVAVIRSLGVDNIFAHLQEYHSAVEEGMMALGFRSLRSLSVDDGRSGILSFRLPEGVPFKSFAAALRDEGVFPSTPDGLLRFAPHFGNPLSERQLVLSAVEAALTKAR